MAWHHAAPPMATTQTSVSHVWPLGTTLDAEGVLQLGGCDARELAREFGTPAYIVVEDDLRTRARRFLAAFAERTDDFEVHFASKSFPATAVLRLFAEEGLACDVASGGELHLALNAGFDPKKIHLHGNAKSEAELRMALDAGIGDIVVDNLVELERLERLIPAGARQRILLRVAPGVSPDTHPKISTGGPNTKFGFNPADAAVAIERAQRSDKLDLDGLHFHIGSQILDLAPFRAALEAVAQLGDFRTYNMGGGLGVAYTHEQSAPEIEDYVERKVSLMREILGEGKRIADEPGRALVAHSTVTLYTVSRSSTTWWTTSPSTAACRTTCVRCSTTPATRRWSSAGRRLTPRTRRLSTSRASTASPATSSSPTSTCPPRGRAISSPCPSPAPTATRWPTTTTVSPGRRSSSSAMGRHARSCAARATRT